MKTIRKRKINLKKNWRNSIHKINKIRKIMIKRLSQSKIWMKKSRMKEYQHHQRRENKKKKRILKRRKNKIKRKKKRIKRMINKIKIKLKKKKIVMVKKSLNNKMKSLIVKIEIVYLILSPSKKKKVEDKKMNFKKL